MQAMTPRISVFLLAITVTWNAWDCRPAKKGWHTSEYTGKREKNEDYYCFKRPMQKIFQSKEEAREFLNNAPVDDSLPWFGHDLKYKRNRHIYLTFKVPEMLDDWVVRDENTVYYP